MVKSKKHKVEKGEKKGEKHNKEINPTGTPATNRLLSVKPPGTPVCIPLNSPMFQLHILPNFPTPQNEKTNE